MKDLKPTKAVQMTAHEIATNEAIFSNSALPISPNAVTDTAAPSKKAAVPQVPFHSAHFAPLLENLVSELLSHQSAADFNDDLNELFSDALGSDSFQDCGPDYVKDKFYSIRLITKFLANVEALQYRAMIPRFELALRHDALSISSNL